MRRDDPVKRFYAPVPADSVWHRLSREERREVTRIELTEMKCAAEYADDEDTEAAVERLRKVFW